MNTIKTMLIILALAGRRVHLPILHLPDLSAAPKSDQSYRLA